MFKLFKYFKKSDWLFTALLIVIVALQVNLDLMLPDLMGDIVGFIQYNALYEEPPRIIVPGSCEYMRARFSNLALPVITRSRMSISRSRVRCLAAVIDLGNLVICA